jgi:hypothetical protein
MTTAKEAREVRAAFPSRPLHICTACRRLLPEWKDGDPWDGSLVMFGSDPYASEINDDETEVWECMPCRMQSADDI